MKTNKLFLSLASLAFCIQACSPKLDAPSPLQPSSGTENFTKFVAIGNSLTAGYADGALYKAGQENSFAKMVNEQMMSFGASAPVMPYMPEFTGGTTALEKDRGFTLNLWY
jgi:hypothetical protein